jgi:hypothetical protein
MPRTNVVGTTAPAGSGAQRCAQASKRERRSDSTAGTAATIAARISPVRADPGTSLTWRRDGTDWILLAGRRRFGRVVPDSKYPGMWRSTLSGGRLSDMANLAWAKNAVLMATERELEWEDRQRAAIAPPKCSEKRGVFESAASPVAKTVEGIAP